MLHETNKPITAGQVEGLKRFTGNDDFAVNPKGKEIEPNVFHLKILVTGNHLPTFEPGLLDDALKTGYSLYKFFQFLQLNAWNILRTFCIKNAITFY